MEDGLSAQFALSPAAFVASSFGFFLSIYLGFGALNLLLTRRLLPACGIGKVLDTRPQRPRQLRTELAWSLLSISVFAIGTLLPWWGIKEGYLKAVTDASLARIVLECLILALWNDVHFYVCHRLLHWKPLFQAVHTHHHRSFVTTPFSTYCFHPVEAALLGSVMPFAMLVHDFSAWSLLFLPVFSIAVNNMGHSNYDLFPATRTGRFWAFSRRHQLHHERFHGNYGFLLPWLDAWLRTRVIDYQGSRPA